MKKMILYLLNVAVIIAVVFICTALANGDKNVEFLNSFGWEVDERYIEKAQITIPAEFDEVYENYNKIQKSAGFDLEKYKGKAAVRYTYIVKNYPDDEKNEVRANVICVKGEPVGGDVMTVNLDGCMNPLNFLDTGIEK